MSDEKNNSLDYLKKIEMLEEKIANIEENFKKKELIINEKTIKQQQNINSIKQELYDVKKKNTKTKEHLLLELESSLDEHNRIQIRNDNYFKEVINFFEQDRITKSDEINKFTENIGKLKQIIFEKDNLINDLKIKQNELELTIKDHKAKLEDTTNKEEIQQAKQTINEQNTKNKKLEETITELTNKTNQLNELNAEKENTINNKEQEIQQAKQTINEQNTKNKKLEETITNNNLEFENLNHEINKLQLKIEPLNKKIKLLEDSLNEKNRSVNSLNEEIKTLKLIIKEQEITINSLNRRTDNE